MPSDDIAQPDRALDEVFLVAEKTAERHLRMIGDANSPPMAATRSTMATTSSVITHRRSAPSRPATAAGTSRIIASANHTVSGDSA